jgi:hypothetical protein
MSLTEIADRINSLFDRYGLRHPVVEVRPFTRLGPAHEQAGVPGRVTLDPRENEPDPMKWRTQVKLVDTDGEAIYLCGDDDVASMECLLMTLTNVFDVFFEVQPESAQGRLF